MPYRVAVLLFQNPVHDKKLIWFQCRNAEARGGCGQDQGDVIFLHTSYIRKTAENIGNSKTIHAIIKALVIQTKRKSGFRRLSGYGVGKGTEASAEVPFSFVGQLNEPLVTGRGER